MSVEVAGCRDTARFFVGSRTEGRCGANRQNVVLR
jgi:hypothetical protein